MPVYHFFLKPTWNPPLIDRDGEELPDDTAAYGHAVEIAREIMRNHETECRSYRLEVCNENLETCSEILFASVDETLGHLRDDFRNSIITAARTMASLNETIREVSPVAALNPLYFFVASRSPSVTINNHHQHQGDKSFRRTVAVIRRKAQIVRGHGAVGG